MNPSRKTTIALFATVLLGLGLALAAPAAAQPNLAQPRQRQADPEILQGIGIDQRLNEQVPLEVRLRDEDGKDVKLGDYLGRKPVVLLPIYFECPSLCQMELTSLLINLKVIPFTVGKEFDVVAFSFDPREKPPLAKKKKASAAHEYARAGGEAGWHFLTGDEDQIKKLTEAIGFRYRFDPASGQYFHAAGLMILTPEGRLSRYLYGNDFSGRDLKLCLMEASQGKIGTLADKVELFCYAYDMRKSKYGWAVARLLQVGGGLTVLALGTFIFFMHRRDHNRRGQGAITTEARKPERI